MDEELILMCNCPEIRDRWDAEMGQTFIQTISGTAMTSISIDREGEVVHLKAGDGDVDSFWAWIHHPSDDFVYIPRLQDVLEWMGDRLDSIEQYRNMDQQQWEVTLFDEGNSFYSNVLIEALLKAYMHLEHNKAWNGEAWI